MLESKIEHDVSVWAEYHKILHLKLNVRGRRGWPDHMYISKGKVVFIEFKQVGEEPTPMQRYIIGLIKAQGVPVEVHDNKESAIGFLNSQLN